MTYGANAAPNPTPRADTARAVHCETCNGWGSVITRQQRHELCRACQPSADRGDGDSSNATRSPIGDQAR